MRTMKSNSGITRRKGITEIQRLIWVMSRPTCSKVAGLMADLTSCDLSSSEQHRECANSRENRDCSDLKKIIEFLDSANPFTGDGDSLRSIATGSTLLPARFF